MNLRVLFAIVVLGMSVAGVHQASAEAKAYEMIHYKGKVGNLTIAFDFASGYAEASKVRVTSGSGKPVRFKMDGAEKLHFVPETGGDGTKEVTITLEPDAEPPAKVDGEYKAGEKTMSFTLTKGK